MELELEVTKLIDHLDDEIENSMNLLWFRKAIVDKEELQETIKDIRLKMPEEIKEAQKIASDRQRIISDAEKEANSILKSAADRVTQMVSEHEISKQAEAHAKEIIEKAQAEAKSMRAATKQYVTSALDELEKTIGDALERVRQARS